MVPAVLQAYMLVAARLSAKHRSVCAKSQDTMLTGFMCLQMRDGATAEQPASAAMSAA
jgi:hypothetical protein